MISFIKNKIKLCAFFHITIEMKKEIRFNIVRRKSKKRYYLCVISVKKKKKHI